MYSSGNNNNDDPLDSLFKRPISFQLNSDLIQNPISKPLDHDPPFFSNFPSPFFDEHELPLNQILLMTAAAADQTHQNSIDSHEYSTTKETTSKRRGSSKLKEKADGHHQITNGLNAPSTRRKNNLGVVPRKRTGKKDRHSKICTAQGIRDRRMRLSLQVARKFFDLQDMLGYDKASKTIEWLFNKSKKAIKELTKENPRGNNVNISILSDAKSESFLSECEVVSGIEENSNNEIKEGTIFPSNDIQIKKSRKNNTKVPNLRESRDKARARARCRTREKMMIKHLENCKSSPNQSDVQKLGSSNSPFDQESGERVSPYDADDFNPSLMQELADEGTIEKLLLGNSSSGYNYHCSATAAVSCCVDPSTNFTGFLGNWELMYNDRMNSSQFSVTNQQVSLAGDPPSSIYSSATTANFPFFQQ